MSAGTEEICPKCGKPDLSKTQGFDGFDNICSDPCTCDRDDASPKTMIDYLERSTSGYKE